MPRQTTEFQTIRSEGGLLPPDILRKVVDPRSTLPGTKPEDFGLPQGERINETITQSWNRLLRHWAEFRKAAQNLPPNEPGTGLTNDKWNIPLLRELGFGLIPTGPGPEIDGKTYAINRFFGPTPIHLVGCGVNLDRRAAGVRGAAQANPHGLVQDFLNRSPGHLWAILSNGLRFRVLRDNQALSRQSYLEFDLEAIFSGEVFSDFVLLWLMAHATRFNPGESGRPDSCWLERWTKIAEEEGTRALGALRIGVEKTLQILGEAFVSHPRNSALRDSLRSGSLSLNDFHSQLLRLVYRLIFLFVAEDRSFEGNSLLHPIDDSDSARLARDRYARHYSTARLRELAGKIKGSRHGDLWQQFNLLVGALSGKPAFDPIRLNLALPSLGSSLWNPQSTSALNTVSLNQSTGIGPQGTELANADLLEALRNLAFTRQGKVLRPVDYKNLGAEELGGVYESLLALTPQISADGARFTFAEFAGNQRKTSGSYYTPDSLVQCLLDSALDPVVEQALKGKTGTDAENALLSLKICDPAVGSGHFLVGAAHRLARHLSRVRAYSQGDSEPSPIQYQQALRDVIGRCLYGVDINPMSAELCKFSLWMEALEPGKPLGFLDHHIQVGNSLLGTTPALMAQGIPDEAFEPIEGDDKKVCSELKKRNKQERLGQRTFMFGEEPSENLHLGKVAQAALVIDLMPDDTTEQIDRKALKYRELKESGVLKLLHEVANAWCAAFVIPKVKSEPLQPRTEITHDIFRNIQENPHKIPWGTRHEIENLARRYQFFHWHLAFPEVFSITSESNDKPSSRLTSSQGFDLILANPPWERVKLQEKEWFAAHGREDIANAPNAAVRKRLIEQLVASTPEVHMAFLDDVRMAEGESHLLRNSGRYPLCGRGDINLYAVFAEGMRSVLNPFGRMGAVLPSGIATDDTTKFFFQDVVEKNALRSLFDFENRNAIFPSVHRSYKFCLFTSGSAQPASIGLSYPSAEFAFFCVGVEDLSDPDKRFALSPGDIALLNPNTRTCPIFRSRRDAELTMSIYRRVPTLVKDKAPDANPWGITLLRMLDMSNDSHLFETQPRNDLLRLYEAKMFHQYDHRWATYELGRNYDLNLSQKNDPACSTLPRYWISKSEVKKRLGNWPHSWLLTYRDIARATDERTSIATVIPLSATACHLCMSNVSSAAEVTPLVANLGAFTFDFAVRQKVGGTHLNFFYVKQLPVLPPAAYNEMAVWSGPVSTIDWLLPRVLELTYTAWDLESFAQDCGYSGPPFVWDDERRFQSRCELDAAFFHFYLPADDQGRWKPARVAEGAVRDETPEELATLEKAFPTPRDAVAYIMETFPIVKRKDEAAHGHYRTKDKILEIYDAMQQAIITGTPYQSPLNPPPGPPTDAQGNFLSYSQIDPSLYPHIHADRA